jgi:carbon monoxide dehydrogenase subunit G
MRPVVVHTAGDLDGPPGLVWEILTDWERQSEWMLEMAEIVVTSAAREGVGVEAKATVSIAGIKTTDVVRVDVWEPEEHLGLRHEGWVRGRGDIRLSPNGNRGTRIDWTEELHPPWGIFGAIGLRLFRPLLARTFRRDLALLQKLVRSRAAPGYPGNTYDQS